jgi:hypothetical protein
MSTSRPGRVPARPDRADLGRIIPFVAVDRALDNARREVIRATACWVNWAQQTTKAIEQADGPTARDATWARLRPVYAAVEQAEESLSDARRQLAAAQCPVCAEPVIPCAPGTRIYSTDGTPHTCAVLRRGQMM